MTIAESPDELSARALRWVEALVQAEGIPWARLSKPLNQCRVALISTAGVHRADQPPFDIANPRGDPSYREIPKETPISQLKISHGHYDQTDAEKDINIILPLERFRELEAEQVIGELAAVNFSFMGFVLEPWHLVEGAAKEVAQKLRGARVDAVFGTPG